MRVFFILYSLLCYLLFLAAFLYLFGFVVNFSLPRTLASDNYGPVALALVVNLFLVLMFGIQHSVMARAGFKRVWTKVIPKPIERSTYVLLSSLLILTLIHFWRPIDGVVWVFDNHIVKVLLWSVCAIGWCLVLVSTFLIDHFSLFGLRQPVDHWRMATAKSASFVTPGPYKIVRHPLYLGFLLAFWFTPLMTVGHLVFSLLMTVYILVGTIFEERDLLRVFGERYRGYQQQVFKLLPWPKK